MFVKESCLACDNAIESPSRVWPHVPTGRRGKECFLVPAAFSILVRHASRARGLVCDATKPAADGQASQGGLVFVLILSIADCHLSPARPSACGRLAGLTAAACLTIATATLTASGQQAEARLSERR